MSYECAECERDLRGGHDPNCSRYVPPRQTGADDLCELGSLSADERDQLAADLQHVQERYSPTEYRDLVECQPCTCRRPYQSSAEPNRRSMILSHHDTNCAWRMQEERMLCRKTSSDTTGVEAEREHVTDGTPCWCGPTTIDPEIEPALEPDGGIDATTDLPLTVGASIVNAATSGTDPWDVNRGPLLPLNDQVFLVRVQSPDRTASGLAIPESAQSKGCECRVLAAGPGAKHARTGVRLPMSVAAGDRVVIGKWQGNEVTVPDHVRAWWNIDDREPVIVVREAEILAVLAGQSVG